MFKQIANFRSLLGAPLSVLLVLASCPAEAEGPPTSNGVISNPTLVANQDVAKAQAVGVITTFMSKGARECDSAGQNCRSVFGADDSMDYSGLQLSGQSISGVQSFSFMSGDSTADQMDSNTIASQMGTLVLACGDTTPKTVAGIAYRMSSCVVNTMGDAQVTFQVCTAPIRGNPVKPPEKVMDCSTDPAAPNFKPLPGYSCRKPTCETEPQGSLNGWSAPTTVSYVQETTTSGSDDAKAKNGLGMVFYPALTGGVTPSFTADSDNMTAVKVVQTAIHNETKQTAVGIRVAFRFKTKVTKEMMVQGTSAVPEPGKNTSAWETIEKLQGNALIPQYQQTYAANGSECMQQIQQGLASDGVVSVCDQNYTNESGIKPGALTAQMASEGQNCGTTAQCLQEVVNTNTWTQTCSADVPLALRRCTTKQDYTLEALSYTRTRTVELCHEERTVATYTCSTFAEPELCRKESLITQGGVDLNSTSGDSSVILVGMADENTGRYRIGAVGDDYWGTGYYKREFVVDILDVEHVKTFKIYQVGFDDSMAVAVNDSWVWQDYQGGAYRAETDNWGMWVEECAEWTGGEGEYTCTRYVQTWFTHWERSTSWSYAVNVDLRPYLRTGRNVIRVDTGVVGGGEGWVFLEISAWRAKCDMKIKNECATYEAAH